MTTITHYCGHTVEYPTNGYLQPETIRDIANVRCPNCATRRYSIPNRYTGNGVIWFAQMQFARRDALQMIERGAGFVTITDHHTGEKTVIVKGRDI